MYYSSVVVVNAATRRYACGLQKHRPEAEPRGPESSVWRRLDDVTAHSAGADLPVRARDDPGTAHTVPRQFQNAAWTKCVHAHLCRRWLKPPAHARACQCCICSARHSRCLWPGEASAPHNRLRFRRSPTKLGARAPCCLAPHPAKKKRGSKRARTTNLWSAEASHGLQPE